MLPSLTPSQTRIARRSEVRFAHDFDQRRAAPVVVDVRFAIGIGEPFVQRLARVFLEVNARDADAREPVGGCELHQACAGERLFVLRNLIALGQIGIEVILARENRRRVDPAAERQRGANREVDRTAVQYRQRARKSEADGTDVRVRRRAERCAAAAEDF